MAEQKLTVDPRFMTYDKHEVQALLDEVRERSFLRDVTEEEYETLTKAEKENGDLYLLYEPED